MKEKKLNRYNTKNIQTFRQKDCYRTELWRALYKKAPKGQFIIFRKTHTEYTLKNYFLIFRKNLSGKRQSKKVI